MNVIVANKYSAMLQGLNIDVIERLDGQFEVDDLINRFRTFFFQRMILDITALKNYQDIRTLQKLSLAFDKIILLLDDSAESSSNDFLSQIISIGIYNFAKDLDGIMYLYQNPNSYRDVAQYHHLGTAMPQPNQPSVIYQQIKEEVPVYQSTKIIGFKNVTKQSGATSLIYMMKKLLEKKYSVVAIESGKSDFRFYNDRNLISATNNNISAMITQHSDKEIILVDINDNDELIGLCQEVIYLLEPSILKLNKLVMINRNVFQNLKNKKVVLNQSMLSSRDVIDFEYESKIKVYYNLPPLNDRAVNNQVLIGFLLKLGFVRLQDGM